MDISNTKFIIRIILKYASNIDKVLELEFSVTIKALVIYQYCSTETFNITPGIYFWFENLQMVQSIFESIIGIRGKGGRGGYIDFRYGY